MEHVYPAQTADFGITLSPFPETAQVNAVPPLTRWTAGWQRTALAAGFIAYLALLVAAALLGSRMLPDQLSFHILRHAIAVHDIHSKLFSNLLLIAVMLPSVLWLEVMCVGWKDSSAHALLFARTPTIRTDIACLLLDQTHMMGQIGRLMMLGLSIISGEAIRAWLIARTGIAVSAAFLPLPLQVVLYFYAYSFFDYWAHRIGHTKLFWALHRYHHSAEEFPVVNAERIHPAGFAGIFLISIPMAVLGAPAEVIIYVNAITVILGYVIHSRIDSDFGWIGRTLIQSPLHHRLHHKLEMDTPTGHFGMVPLWDRLFGGWGGEAHKDMPIGVDTVYRHGFWVMPDLLRDYADFFKGLVGRRKLSPSEL
jgi:sterol desaturase/sphingolipid hydroxylase (fatty acid hydroxylase superfamily)